MKLKRLLFLINLFIIPTIVIFAVKPKVISNELRKQELLKYYNATLESLKYKYFYNRIKPVKCMIIKNRNGKKKSCVNKLGNKVKIIFYESHGEEENFFEYDYENKVIQRTIFFKKHPIFLRKNFVQKGISTEVTLSNYQVLKIKNKVNLIKLIKRNSKNEITYKEKLKIYKNKYEYYLNYYHKK